MMEAAEQYQRDIARLDAIEVLTKV